MLTPCTLPQWPANAKWGAKEQNLGPSWRGFALRYVLSPPFPLLGRRKHTLTCSNEELFFAEKMGATEDFGGGYGSLGFYRDCLEILGNRPNTVSETHRVPGRELSEFLSAYYLSGKAHSLSFSQNSPSLPQNSVRLSEFSSPKQYSRNSIPPVS